MSRNLEPTTIKKFQGLDVWATKTSSSPERATDLVNVIPSTSGGVEKLRIPTALSSPISGHTTGPDTFAQFSNANTGVRQVLAQFGQVLGVYSSSWAFTQLDNSILNGQGDFDYISANNLFFGTNGARDFKWDGTALTKWGIDPPSAAPTIGTAPAPPSTPISIVAAATVNSLPGPPPTTFRDTINRAQLFGSGAFGINQGDIIEVDSVTDTSFNGIYVNIQTSPGADVLYTNIGPTTTSTGGTVTDYNQSGVFRYNNEVTVTTSTPHGLNSGALITIASVTDSSFDGNFAVDTVISPTQFTYQQVGPSGFSGSGTMTPRNTAPAYTLGGRAYRISFANSATGHVGNAGPISARTGNLDGTIEATVTCPASTDPQVDSAWLWATVDGGGDFFFDQTIAIVPLTAPVFHDTVMDANLNTAIIAPLVNNPPVLGNYVVKWNSRIIILDLVGDAQGAIYSGYDRILVGRPEESFPPNNRLRLQIGADGLRGAGAITQGLILFSQSNQMFLLRGTLQDITVDAPVQPSVFLQELPWAMGTFAKRSVVPTPQGLCFLGSDKTIQLLSLDASNLSCLSTAYNPILRRITPGSESTVEACFFNFLEREWYAISFSLDGSPTNNTILIVDLDPDPTKNCGAFLWSLEADAIGVIEDSTGQRELVISNSGLINLVKALSDTVGGISDPITATTGSQGANWLSGVFGNTDGYTMKMFRWAKVVVDQPGFYMDALVYDELDDMRYPRTVELGPIPTDGRVSVNEKGRRIQYRVRFPATDASANLLELTSVHIPLAQR